MNEFFENIYTKEVYQIYTKTTIIKKTKKIVKYMKCINSKTKTDNEFEMTDDFNKFKTWRQIENPNIEPIP